MLRFRCRYCDAVLPAWYPVPPRPDGATLLWHLSCGGGDPAGGLARRGQNHNPCLPIPSAAPPHPRQAGSHQA